VRSAAPVSLLAGLNDGDLIIVRFSHAGRSTVAGRCALPRFPYVRPIRSMGSVAERSRRNYETLRLGIQDLFPPPQHYNRPAPHGQFVSVRREFTCRLNG
jgi:hypothetical protein